MVSRQNKPSTTEWVSKTIDPPEKRGFDIHFFEGNIWTCRGHLFPNYYDDSNIFPSNQTETKALFELPPTFVLPRRTSLYEQKERDSYLRVSVERTEKLSTVLRVLTNGQ